MRTAIVERKTKETDVKINLCLDGGEISVATGIGFFDHMLTAFAAHGGFGLSVSTKGDLDVDTHHTVEDTGIVLGKAFKKALGAEPIKRFGSFSIPMDESLAMVTLDVSNRPFLVFNASFSEELVGQFESATCEEFMRAFAVNAGLTLHVNCLYGSNTHHQIEAIFKALGHALSIAVQRADAILSTKGTI